jgi:hypothetical protein
MRPRHLRAPFLLAALAVVAAFAACTLNPQPLPPRDEFSSGPDFDASTKADAGGFSNGPQTPGTAVDAAGGTPSADSDGGVDDGGDGGVDDGGDGGDGGTDAAADAG